MAGIVVKARARILHGHDWVFSGEVLKVFGKPADGDVISLKDGKDHLIGSAIYNSKSQIVARRFSRRKQDLDLDFFQRRIAQAAEYRARRGIDLQLCRLVWSESDGLPGVIVDRYGEHLVLQTLTLGMDLRKDLIVEALRGVVRNSGRDASPKRPTNAEPNSTDGSESRPYLIIVERNDAAVRKAEGLELKVGVLDGVVSASRTGSSSGELSASMIVEISATRGGASIQFEIDLLHGHKTGFYLDQKENYGIVAEYSLGRRVLDCFTNQGAFALACAHAGATEVTAVEASSENLATAKKNGDRNKLYVQWIEQDVFQFLRAAEKAEAQYDLIILDPPSFTKSKGGLHDAMRGYKELHVRAFKLLSRDGILATFSCSHHVSHEAFANMIRDALVDARRSARRIRRFEQPLDHPVLPTLPETEYFKGFLLEMMPGR